MSGGRLDVTVSATGMTQQGNYRIKNGLVKFTDFRGRGLVLAMRVDGCLESRFFGTVCRVDSATRATDARAYRRTRFNEHAAIGID